MIARVGGPAVKEGEREAGGNVSSDRLWDRDRAASRRASGDEACASGVELVRAGVQPVVARLVCLGVVGKETAEYGVSDEACVWAVKYDV